LPEISVPAGSTFYTVLKEHEYFPNGFAFEEPTVPFKCAKVLNKNFGGFNAGYKVWMIEANAEICEEKITLLRPSWWSGDDKNVELSLKVHPTPCPKKCDIGMKRASDTSCECVKVKTEPVIGALYSAHEITVGSTTRVMMDFDEEVTLREWAVDR